VYLWIQYTVIRESRPQRSFDSFAGLIAVFRALRRLLAPRHPPHALSSLAALIPSSALNDQGGRRRHRFQVTNPIRGPCLRFGLAGMGESNDPIFLSLRLMQRSQETTTRRAHARRAVVACELQLLPLPICQRTMRASQRDHRSPYEGVGHNQLTEGSCFLHHPAPMTRGREKKISRLPILKRGHKDTRLGGKSFAPDRRPGRRLNRRSK
jgi:hypothetical protein